MENSFKIADLIVKKTKGTISPAEELVLTNWLNESPENLSTFNKAIDSKTLLDKFETNQLFNKEKAWRKIENTISKERSLQLKSRKLMYYAAAVVIPLLIASSVVFFLQKPETTTLANIDKVITPGTQKATLVLSDGGSVDLARNQSLNDIDEENVTIKNKDNALIYTSEKKSRRINDLVHNILQTPRGGGYNLILADGTEVWLNAASSLKFPVDFTDSTRKVFLEGEAYFKVSHNGKPFIVNTGNIDVRVLGTSFNISAYPDDAEIKTTLVEGKVKVQIAGNDNSANSEKILTPDKQAVVSRNNSTIEISKVNTSQYTSWVQGKLEFNNESLEVVMKSLARWYNFDYKFENSQAQGYHFSARVDNTETISNILEMLEMATNVKFEIQENTIVIN